MSSQPPSDKKPGFLNAIGSAMREISAEVRKDLRNERPTGYTPTTPSQSSGAAAPPPPPVIYPAGTVPPVTGNHAQTEEGPTLPNLTEELQGILLNPWPALRDNTYANRLRSDAYYHPYTLNDLDFYARDILPATNPEIVSLVAVEAGDTTLLQRLTTLFKTSPGLFGSVGYNPRNLQPDLEAMDAHLTSLLNNHPHILSIGPIGLDANYNASTLPQQIAQLQRQLEVAADFELPAIVFHNKAIKELTQTLRNTVLPKRLVWLKPIRSTEELDLIQELDFHVILRAELTHPRETFYQNALRQLLPQRLLIGSGNSLNAAYRNSGQFNSSVSLPDILTEAARQLKMPPMSLQARVNTNFAHIYGGNT